MSLGVGARYARAGAEPAAQALAASDEGRGHVVLREGKTGVGVALPAHETEAEGDDDEEHCGERGDSVSTTRRARENRGTEVRTHQPEYSSRP